MYGWIPLKGEASNVCHLTLSGTILHMKVIEYLPCCPLLSPLSPLSLPVISILLAKLKRWNETKQPNGLNKNVGAAHLLTASHN
jgi:hypothetical protein